MAQNRHNPELPQPTTAGEVFQLAILNELRGLREDIKNAQLAPKAPEVLNVKEPSKQDGKGKGR